MEISSNGQNCYILSQKMLTFELSKHNDELFNLCYRIFYERTTQGSFQQSLVEIGTVVSEEKIFLNIIHPFF
jgi:hypothetical protein